MPVDHQPLPSLLNLERIERICAERGVRFTPLRRIAFEALLEFDGPAGAYDLLHALQERLGKPIGPPTAYRALEFLQKQGFVTRIETRNAFIPCSDPGDGHSGAILLCDRCGATVEMKLARFEAELARRAAALGFQIDRRVVELQGTCADCQETTSPVEGRVAKGGRG